jgi:hypothetical protein
MTRFCRLSGILFRVAWLAKRLARMRNPSSGKSVPFSVIGYREKRLAAELKTRFG